MRLKETNTAPDCQGAEPTTLGASSEKLLMLLHLLARFEAEPFADMDISPLLKHFHFSTIEQLRASTSSCRGTLQESFLNTALETQKEYTKQLRETCLQAQARRDKDSTSRMLWKLAHHTFDPPTTKLFSTVLVDGSPSSNPAIVKEKVRESFAKKFHNHLNRIPKRTLNLIHSTLKDWRISDPSKLEAPITEDEVRFAIRQLNKCSVPGPEGIDPKLYEHLPSGAISRLASDLSTILNQAAIPQHWKTRKLFLLYKKGDPRLPSNWRPICPNPTDEKILSCIILRRSMAALPLEKLPATLWGFLPNRSTLEPTFFLDLLFDPGLFDREQTPFYIFDCDISGAFDVCPFVLIEEVWRTLQLPFLPFLQAYLRGNQAIISTAHGDTLPFPVLSGVPQGGTLSPFLWLLSLLPICIAVEHLLEPTTPKIGGFPLPSALWVFADDIHTLSVSRSMTREAANLLCLYLIDCHIPISRERSLIYSSMGSMDDIEVLVFDPATAITCPRPIEALHTSTPLRILGKLFNFKGKHDPPDKALLLLQRITSWAPHCSCSLTEMAQIIDGAVNSILNYQAPHLSPSHSVFKLAQTQALVAIIWPTAKEFPKCCSHGLESNLRPWISSANSCIPQKISKGNAHVVHS